MPGGDESRKAAKGIPGLPTYLDATAEHPRIDEVIQMFKRLPNDAKEKYEVESPKFGIRHFHFARGVPYQPVRKRSRTRVT